MKSCTELEKPTLQFEQTETLLHLFTACNKTKGIWDNIITELLAPYGIESLTATEIILGVNLDEKNHIIINHIILEAKYYIYVCKIEETMPVYARLKNRLKITKNI